MDSNGSNTVPTASLEMFQSKGVNGYGNNKQNYKHEPGRRHRSKSEGYELHNTPDYVNEVLKSDGMVIKSAKDKAHDRKPRNLKGRGQPKKGIVLKPILLLCFKIALISFGLRLT